MDEEKTYRDAVTTVDEKGKRIWLFPKIQKGVLHNRRKVVGYLLLALMFAGPFLTINGKPLVLINILDRDFIIFGVVFHPQDTHLFALSMIVGVLGVTLFTVVFGRLFCGWVCPQTIFMELVFRKIEYWIDGDANAQRRLAKEKWNTKKLWKRALKYTIFWLVSFMIANVFLSYVIGKDALFAIMTEPIEQHIGGFISILVFSSVFFAVFSFMREQVCTFVCPYGRLQSVLLDRNSLVVAYDDIRGENRGKLKKTENRAETGKGDCIDCGLCVQVCPTGIDIRNGTQLECINCTLCIDACNSIMEKVDMDPGLIRFASRESIENKTPFKLTTRSWAYSGVLVVLMIVLTSLLVGRAPVETTILRTRGTLFTKMDDHTYSNIYDVILVNKTDDSLKINLKARENVEIELIGDDLWLPPMHEKTSKFMVKIDKANLAGRKTELHIDVFEGDDFLETIETSFIGPIQ